MNDKKIAVELGKTLLQKKETIAVAESVTSGLLQFEFSTIPDASQFFQGGITAYNIGQKYKHLQVEPIHATSTNCVSQKVAIEMALHICQLFSSHWGIAITGYASPVPESNHKIYSFFAISYKNKIVGKGKIIPTNKEPKLVQREYVLTIMDKLLQLMKN